MTDEVSGASGRQPVSGVTKAILVGIFVVFCITQAWLQLKPDGAIERHTFIGGFDAYFKLSLADPIMLAGMIDLLVVFGVLIVILAHGIPGPKKWLWFFPIVLAGVVYPGFAALLFLLLFWKYRNQFTPQ